MHLPPGPVTFRYGDVAMRDGKMMQNRLKQGIFVLYRVMMLLVITAVFAQGHAPAGLTIQNQAFATDARGKRYFSNVVETLVLAICQPSVTPNGVPEKPGAKVAVSRGGTVVLHYTVTNVGNTDSTFSLTWIVADQSEWRPVDVHIFEDTNANKRLDSGDREVNEITLPAGSSREVLVAVKAPRSASGKAYVSLIAACPSGETDHDNYIEIKVRNGPKLVLRKVFNPSRVIPGETTQVTLTLENVGDEYSEGVILQDDLADLDGLEFVHDSARVSKGYLEFYDGESWVNDESDVEVHGIRVRLDWLAPNERVVLRFALRVQPGHAPGDLINHAVAKGPGGPASASAEMSIPAIYRHYLGPKGNPRALPGGEGSPSDWQSKEAFAGQKVCFGHSLENASNTVDKFVIEYSGIPEEVEVVLETLDGQPLEMPIELGPTEIFDFRFCVTIPTTFTESFTVELVARSMTTGRVNRTYDEIIQIISGSLELTKRVEPEGTISAGQELVYSLTVVNNYPVDLHEVQIIDPLSDFVEYVESTPEGAYFPEDHKVVWTLSELKSGSTWSAEVRVRVSKSIPDDALIENVFRLVCEDIDEPVESNTVRNKVWSSGVLIEKTVTPRSVRVGDIVHYRITLVNTGSTAVTIDLVDKPDPALRYVDGSGRPREPQIVEGQLIWPDVHLEPGEKVVFEYDMRVVSGASGELKNIAIAEGVSSGGSTVTTEVVRAKVEVVDAVFASRKATLIGRVFLDFDEDGLYDEGEDKPLPGARLVLSNGLQATTDGEGRYAFRDIPPGIWVLLLDSSSAPFTPMAHPEALDKDRYAHRIEAYGLTISDFPLMPPTGWIRGYRKTILSIGPLVVEKELLPLGEGRYRVVIRLKTSMPLPELELIDPLPTGGERKFMLDTLEGQKTLTYELKAPVWLTDPKVHWRYP